MICPHCNGSGSLAIEPGCSTRYRCTDCNGSGMSDPDDDDPERGREEVECDDGEDE